MTVRASVRGKKVLWATVNSRRRPDKEPVDNITVHEQVRVNSLAL